HTDEPVGKQVRFIGAAPFLRIKLFKKGGAVDHVDSQFVERLDLGVADRSTAADFALGARKNADLAVGQLHQAYVLHAVGNHREGLQAPHLATTVKASAPT